MPAGPSSRLIFLLCIPAAFGRLFYYRAPSAVAGRPGISHGRGKHAHPGNARALPDIVSSAIKGKDMGMLSAMAGKGVIARIDYWDTQDGTIGDERIGELCKPSLPKARELLAARLSALPSDTTVAASDTMNGATFGKVRDGWFHPGIGYWDPSGRHLATEAFAEMFAAHISTPQEWGTAVDYFPESCTMFETMLREAL